VWGFVFALLVDNSWVEEQLAVEQKECAASAKLLELEQRKIAQIKAKIAKVQEGFEAEVYSVDEAKMRIGSYQDAIARTEKETERFGQHGNRGFNTGDIDTLRQELRVLAEKNLEGADFKERRDVISKLDIRIYPSEDLKTMRVRCGFIWYGIISTRLRFSVEKSSLLHHWRHTIYCFFSSLEAGFSDISPDEAAVSSLLPSMTGSLLAFVSAGVSPSRPRVDPAGFFARLSVT
jgi:uncharacterized small protein (DUF1192 family)